MSQAQKREDNRKSDESCISNPKSEILNWTVRFEIVQFRDLRCRICPISDFFSQSYHLRIHGAREARFFGAFDDGAAVFEDRNFIWRGGTLQEKFVELDGSERADGFGELGEIKVAFHPGNELNGVASTKGDR